MLMPVSPARTAAFDILMRVERTAAYASELLHSAKHEKLSSEDHGLTTELVMGLLRWRSLLDTQIASVSSPLLQKLDLEVLTASRLAAYQILFLDRIPRRAAVHESVELVKQARKRSAAGFVNALLRKLLDREKPATILDSHSFANQANEWSTLAELSAHPPWMVERWTRQFGIASAREICRFDQQPPEPAIRPQDASAGEELCREGIEFAPGRLLASARRVIAGNLTQTRAFREGRVVIQDEASQLVALLVGNGRKILDCCAAPGGKTRILAEQNPGARVVAVELHPQRAQLLRKRTPAAVEVVNRDVRGLESDQQFDRVLADVPCSGTGTLARNPEIKWRLQAQNLTDLHRLQVEILRSAMQQVANGGEVVYSTCSLEPEEGEQVLEQVLAENPAFRLVDSRARLLQLQDAGELVWNDLRSLSSGPHLRTLPGVHPCEGFFAAILQKS
jgi:16S rRNA (cytosine967-C5)-methyltransferase